MPDVGVRELKARASEIVRNVRDRRARYTITYRGRPVAVLLPVDEGWMEGETERALASARPGQEVWAELEALREEIGQSWRSDKTAVELVSEQRR